MFQVSGLVCLSVSCNRPSGYWMLTSRASMYPAMKGRFVYIKHRRTPRGFINTRVVHQCLTVTTPLHLHLSNLAFPSTFSPILKWHPNKSQKATDGTSSQRRNSNMLRRTFKTSQKRRPKWSVSSAAYGPSGFMALSFGTSPPSSTLHISPESPANINFTTGLA